MSSSRSSSRKRPRSISRSYSTRVQRRVRTRAVLIGEKQGSQAARSGQRREPHTPRSRDSQIESNGATLAFFGFPLTRILVEGCKSVYKTADGRVASVLNFSGVDRRI